MMNDRLNWIPPQLFSVSLDSFINWWDYLRFHLVEDEWNSIVPRAIPPAFLLGVLFVSFTISNKNACCKRMKSDSRYI